MAYASALYTSASGTTFALTNSDGDAIEYLNMVEGTEVNVELDREKRQIVITPAEPPLVIAGVDPEFSHQISEFIEQYRSALDELAK